MHCVCGSSGCHKAGNQLLTARVECAGGMPGGMGGGMGGGRGGGQRRGSGGVSIFALSACCWQHMLLNGASQTNRHARLRPTICEPSGMGWCTAGPLDSFDKPFLSSLAWPGDLHSRKRFGKYLSGQVDEPALETSLCKHGCWKWSQ